MANPADVKASWLKRGTFVCLTNSITDGATASKFELLDTTYESAWPTKKTNLARHGMPASGKAIAGANDITLGRDEPGLSMSLPCTDYALTIMVQSLWQDTNWNGVSGLYSPQVFNDHAKSVADMFMYIEAGMDGAALWQMKGGIVTKLGINIPAVDADLGKIVLTADIMGAQSTRDTAFAISSPVLDPGTPSLASDVTFKINTVAVKMVSAQIDLVNFAARGLNAGSTPDHYSLGPSGASGQPLITGNVVLVMTGSFADDWGDLQGFHEAKTVTELHWLIASHWSLGLDAILGTPTYAKQGNVYVVTVPFESVYVDANEPSATLSHASDLFAWV